MQVENANSPAPNQVLAALWRDNGNPICMVNLLKFHDKAVYADRRETTLTGQQAYLLYANPMIKMVEEAGGQLIFSGQVRGLLIGKVEANWDAVGIVKYPSFKALTKIAASAAFAGIHVHRDAGLKGQLLLETVAL